MTDRDFWLIIRRALLMVVKAIERKYTSKEVPLETGGNASVSFMVDD
jgi:hypothetical protein